MDWRLINLIVSCRCLALCTVSSRAFCERNCARHVCNAAKTYSFLCDFGPTSSQYRYRDIFILWDERYSELPNSFRYQTRVHVQFEVIDFLWQFRVTPRLILPRKITELANCANLVKKYTCVYYFLCNSMWNEFIVTYGTNYLDNSENYVQMSDLE